ncbi:MAG: ABC transporter permease [Mesorhizobium sp.]|nr:ABC transporter permease [Mesorhizobium sp.]
MLLLPLLVTVLLLASSFYDRRSGKAVGPGFFQRNGIVVAIFLIAAVACWTFLTIIFPQVAMIELSFHPNLSPRQIGGPGDVYTLDNYRYFLFGPPGSPDGYNFLHLRAYGITIVASVFVTLLNFILCYPLAFYMAQSALPQRLRLLFVFLILPYWINEVLRVFAIRLLLSNSGIVNTLLLSTGMISQPVDFVGNDVGLYWGLSYSCILVMVFTLYNALESLDKNQIEAARDLGAPWWHVHAFVVMPHAKPGIASGCALTFMACVGSLAAPLILGGPRTLWFTPVIYNRFYQALNWPQGAAYAFILLVGCVIFVLVTLRLFKLKLGQIAP